MPIPENTHGTWAEINLDALAANLEEILRLTGAKSEICAVVKADAYGHGAVVCSREFISLGVSRLAVANISEGIELRNAGIQVPILIMSYTPDHRAADLIQHQLTPTVISWQQAEALYKTARNLNKSLPIHIKINTGMNRLGFQPTFESAETIQKISSLPNLQLEGVFSHLALFFTADNSFSLKQANILKNFVRSLEDMGISVPIVHLSNSAGLVDLEDEFFDMVRPGSALYGLPPRAGMNKSQMNIQPVMSIKTIISAVRNIEAGDGVSYGHTFIADKPTKIAAIPMGYADGITKIASGKTYAIVRGKLVQQIGMICMDQCLLDVTGVEEVTAGDEVIFVGTDGNLQITADDRALLLGTGNCEVVCSVSRRVPRVYYKNNRIIHIENYLID
ncbi:MAG: alanine racemase [Tindallia sp. MSAO_Bac2]|nr:MAG: alanine racemase [Tindallia sp. MSAO_Bac2]